MADIVPAGALHAGDTVLLRLDAGECTEAQIRVIDISPDGCRAFVDGMTEPVCYASGDLAVRIGEAAWPE